MSSNKFPSGNLSSNCAWSLQEGYGHMVLRMGWGLQHCKKKVIVKGIGKVSKNSDNCIFFIHHGKCENDTQQLAKKIAVYQNTARYKWHMTRITEEIFVTRITFISKLQNSESNSSIPLTSKWLRTSKPRWHAGETAWIWWHGNELSTFEKGN